MGFSRVASLHLVPLIARIVLCAVFVPIGWNKIMTTANFTGEEAVTIRRLMNESPMESETPENASETSAETSPAEDIEARRVYGLASMLDSSGVQYPVIAAWLTATVELVGGGLLLVGLFSRVWGIGLAIAMSVAFALTSWPVISDVGPFALEMPVFNSAAAQIALAALGLGIFLGGPGGIAIDHGIFGRHHREKGAIREEEAPVD